MRERLGELAMEGAEFAAELSARDGYGPAGGDEVEFRIAPNPGVPPGPLREIASGGELSRVMLALMSVAAEAGPATLVFDEVDAGHRRPDGARGGGGAARASRPAARSSASPTCRRSPRWPTATSRSSRTRSGETARTTVTQLGRGDVVGELVRMLGADGEDRAARRHARELLRAA